MTRPKKPADPSPSDPPRAPVAPPVALRVREIRRRLERGVWSGEQAAELATEWGITEAMVRGHAAEAARQMEAILDAAGAPQAIIADLNTGIDLAMATGDLHALAKLTAEKIKVYGIGAHHSRKNDPRPVDASPQAATKRPFWRKDKAEDKPS